MDGLGYDAPATTTEEITLSDHPIPPVRRSSQPAFQQVILANVLKKARSLKWYDWASLGGAVVVGLFWVLPAFRAAPPSTTIQNPSDRLRIPQFNPNKQQANLIGSLNDFELNQVAFNNEQRQRAGIQIAQGFRAMAAMYVQTPGHICAGKSTLQCLDIFWANRERDYKALLQTPKAKAITPQSAFSNPLANFRSLALTEGLMLAIALETPPQQRRQAQQFLIDSQYPLLNQLGADQLFPQPALALQQLKQRCELALQLKVGDPEEQARAAYELQQNQQSGVKENLPGGSSSSEQPKGGGACGS